MTATRRKVRGVLEEVAELLGLAISEGATLAGLRVDALKKRTQKQLLEVAKKLDVSGVSKLPKDELAARVLDALKASVRAELVAAASSGAVVERATVAASPTTAGGADHGRRAKNAARIDDMPTPTNPGRTKAPKKNGVGTKADVIQETAHVGVEGATPDEAVEGAVAPIESQKEKGAGDEPTSRAKFELGSAAKARQLPVGNIPWGYGIDRVTAMVVDPERMFVYWEVTDEAISRARAALGTGGAGAWLCVRIYDTTGRLFDGTNANSYFDHNVGRDDRQWFFQIGKPTSTAFVDIGLKSTEGFYVRVARSNRVDFPRTQPSHEGDVEWLTVRVATGHVESAGRGAPSLPSPPPPAPLGSAGETAVGTTTTAGLVSFEPLPLWMMRQVSREGGAREQRLLTWLDRDGEGGWQRVEWNEVVGEGWFGVEGRVEWQGPLTVTSWEVGPFSYPVEVSEPTRDEWQGASFGYRKDGVTHLVYGPWQVVIRNLGAHYGRTVLSEWQVYRSWVVEGGHETKTLGLPLGSEGSWVSLGASEGMFVGASERRWQTGSELRLAGASERFRMGASEVRFGGASERRMIGASERTLRGASERRFMGASGFAFGGASESHFVGASERAFRGASEHLGGSEGRLAGGSEVRLGTGEQRPRAYPDPNELPVDEIHGRYPKLEG